MIENRHGGGFPRCCSVDKACLVSTVAAISEMASITDNPLPYHYHGVITVTLHIPGEKSLQQ
ncbi:hypothetical protein JWG39_11885 [Desulforhopalus vacuolatus]|uniref:hypothetical protein n=1 Tax=Desulforhopalus vacuolatus TaxID=40414 RepID=UPI001963D827|nr:hypothetical protein [Desulforhopalus vacuolatus]MBM9520515.1 hypothetical protein [Desulforhopalus vacuolatus]